MHSKESRGIGSNPIGSGSCKIDDVGAAQLKVKTECQNGIEPGHHTDMNQIRARLKNKGDGEQHQYEDHSGEDLHLFK